MTDDEIRGLVRLAIQKHTGSSTFAPSATADRPAAAATAAAPPQSPAIAISFGRYPLPRAEDDTMCIIEPAVQCNHCGYCQCHGH